MKSAETRNPEAIYKSLDERIAELEVSVQLIQHDLRQIQLRRTRPSRISGAGPSRSVLGTIWGFRRHISVHVVLAIFYLIGLILGFVILTHFGK